MKNRKDFSVLNKIMKINDGIWVLNWDIFFFKHWYIDIEYNGKYNSI